MVLAATSVLLVSVFTVMVSLHFYANTSQTGLYLMLKSVGMALAVNFILSVPVFVKNYKRSYNFLAQDSERLEVIYNFWEVYATNSNLKF